MNERIKLLRKKLGFTQKEFSEKLGLTQTGVSWMEQAGNGVTEQSIRLICKLFDVNENWLRTGEEPMFIEHETFSLDRYIKEKGASDEEVEIVKAYFSLEPGMRKALFEHFRAYFLHQSAKDGEGFRP